MAQLFMSGLDIHVIFFYWDNPAFCSEEKEEISDDEEREEAYREASVDKNVKEGGYEDDQNESFSEDLTLWMPFYIGVFYIKEVSLADLIKEEVQLHIRQANDSLEKLRTHLGHKSILYEMNFQSSTLVRTDTRSKQDI